MSSPDRHPNPSPEGRGAQVSNADQHPARVLKLILDIDKEQHRVLAVDDAMVVADRDVHHRRGDDSAERVGLI